MGRPAAQRGETTSRTKARARSSRMVRFLICTAMGFSTDNDAQPNAFKIKSKITIKIKI
jgi:hypothetical protein